MNRRWNDAIEGDPGRQASAEQDTEVPVEILDGMEFIQMDQLAEPAFVGGGAIQGVKCGRARGAKAAAAIGVQRGV
jgi:hypothetical protein